MWKFRFRDSSNHVMSSLQLKCRIVLLLWVMLCFCDGRNCHIFTWQWNLRLLNIRLALIPHSNAWYLASLEEPEFVLSTGWISEIWTEVQVIIYCIYIASTETNDTSEESSTIKLLYDTLKKIFVLKVVS